MVRTVLCFFLVALFSVTGCTSSVKVGAVPVRPIDLLLGGASPESSAGAEKANFLRRQQALAACMKKLGFDYPLASYESLLSPSSVKLPVGREVAAKRLNGYGYADKIEKHIRSKDFGRLVNPPSTDPAYERSLRGTTTADGTPGGCQGKVDAAARDKFKEASAVLIAYDTRRKQNAQFRSIVQTWSACMARGGFEVPDPDIVYDRVFQEPFLTLLEGVSFGETSDDARQRIIDGPLAEFRQLELRVAEIDADCMNQEQVDSLRVIDVKIREEISGEYVETIDRFTK